MGESVIAFDLLVVPKAPVYQPEPEIIPEKYPSAEEYSDSRLSNPLVASTVDDFVPDDNDYETFLVDDTHSQSQSISMDPTFKSSHTKLSTTTDESVSSLEWSDSIWLYDCSSENEMTINPMVKGFREQLDSDDEEHQPVVMWVILLVRHHLLNFNSSRNEPSADYEPASPTIEAVSTSALPLFSHSIHQPMF